VKPPTSEMDARAPTKREPAPFAGNHVVDLEAVKQQLSSVAGEDGLALPVKRPFTDFEDGSPVF